MDIFYNSMSTTWKNKMIEQDFNRADSTVKEMTDFFRTRVESLEASVATKKKKTRKASRSVNKKTLTPVL